MVNQIFAITTYHEPGEKATLMAEEWRRLGICAIGWSSVNFCACKSKEDVIKSLKTNNYDIRSAEDIWLFINEINAGDLILAYSRNNIIAYVGVVKGPCQYVRNNSVGDPNGEFDYAHQRKVEWWDEPHHFDRHDLPKYFADQLGRRGKTVVKIDLGQKSFKSFIKILKVCANSGARMPGMDEDVVKAGIVKYLYHSIDRLEKGLKIKHCEIAIGKQRKARPDFIAEDKNGRIVLIECKGIAGESAVEQVKEYEEQYGKGKDVRLMIVAFRINQVCRKSALKAGNVELFECDLNFHKIQ
jgi:predicted Mrr-cat superfamily restriction endonuclease